MVLYNLLVYPEFLDTAVCKYDWYFLGHCSGFVLFCIICNLLFCLLFFQRAHLCQALPPLDPLVPGLDPDELELALLQGPGEPEPVPAVVPPPAAAEVAVFMIDVAEDDDIIVLN